MSLATRLSPPALDDSRGAFFDARPPASGDVDLSVTIGSLTLANPVMPASGCFGPELGRLIPVDEIGATVTKTVFAGSRGGNPAHRLTEIPAGMVNSVGIPSKGPRGYLSDLHPAYAELGVPVIISVGGHRPDEYAPIVAELDAAGAAFEINVSCPNLDRNGVDIGADPDAITQVVESVRAVTDKPLIVKLPPMVSSIVDCARAAESAGADALCVSNSVPALPLDSVTLRPALGNVIGGLTGPSMRPIILRLVWLTSTSVQVPVIACGGIETANDALEYFSVGARAVQVGTASFSRPYAMVDIVRELTQRCRAAGATTVAQLVG
ncbi:dihydroorotate dehydrogenase [Cryobacterium tepidiphilum]|uniref:Dihydroorotate dehydrogenase n=1 Tax=Cryobacterium tepidiphilum TaxID=2486026 RepID=A0A3M8KTC2_9MICO|nr:dihydroorotate dehydrogenase [Cryobacterium tepidiphilum]RNE56513.1 dihydroorotate dehydrogenase [Cryobacterium tepidiphilum]